MRFAPQMLQTLKKIMKIVFLDAATMGNISLVPLEKLGEFIPYPNSTPEEARSRVGDAEVIIVNKVLVDEALMDAAPALKLICEAATGVNNIDVEAAAKRGIPVKNVAGYSTESVLQITWMHILSLLCIPAHYDAEVKDFTYSRSGMPMDVTIPFPELDGKTIGIIGMGAIGHRVAEIASAFRMRVIYYSTSGTSHCTDWPSVSLDTLLAESDIISIHAPMNDRTRGLIGAAELAKMKKNAILVNLGRGGIADEGALADAIDKGIIAGAALDVYTTEPLPEDSPLLHTSHPERLRFTPHIGWASAEARDRLVLGIAENIVNTPI